MKLLFAAFILANAAWPAANVVSLRTAPARAELKGARASQQFLAVAKYSDGTERDVTAVSEWHLSNAALAKFISPARVAPSADGDLILTASFSGIQAKSTLKIEDAAAAQPITFQREISAILTTRGCNNSTCHGGVKGQGGFKLSANALYPAEDYEWITKGGGYQVLTAEVKGERIPRIDRANPEKSLLLSKPTMVSPHGGGKRFGTDSEDYRTVLGWIRGGAPYSSPGAQAEAKLTRLELYPSVAIVPVQAEHHLLVTAHFNDGHTEDYTHQSLYTVNDGDVAAVSPGGVVSAKRRGETSILIRAAGQVATAGVGVIGPPIPNYPEIARFNIIDEHIFPKLRKFQIIPSDLAGDSEFLRRVCLDLTGTLPPPRRAREFLASTDPRKREKLIDALIASPEFVDYWTFRFADLFRVSIFSNGLSPKWMEEYWEWIRNNIETNRPYDQVARERIAVEGYKPPSRHFLPYNQVGSPADAMAEEVRVFMGRRLDCAQCHNHPYENWSQDQFWGMAAFFSRMFRMGQVVVDHPTNMDLGTKDVGGSMDLLHPRTKAVVKPTVLDNSPLAVTPESNPRKELARWMTSHPYFAEAAVNRIWANFFARGIVDPVDDFRSTNPPTHPELLSALAANFRDQGYNLRRLMKIIVSSRTYQLSRTPNATNREDVSNFSRSLSRGLDAEVLLDAVADVTGIPETFSTAITEGAAVGQALAGTRAIQLRDPDTFFSRFLELYGRSNRGAVPERNHKPNLSQALHVLAGATYLDRLSQPNSRLAKLLKLGSGDEEIFNEFYVAALSRLPAADEVQEMKTILAQRADREAGLREFVWALISSREFAENH
ncbi:MAG TPA: DUF1549 domain-containing protein [Bryobacteraceae bacterium]|nr:DUF1549 domain-containing protein [Bryobacteraceae bacterium]